MTIKRLLQLYNYYLNKQKVTYYTLYGKKLSFSIYDSPEKIRKAVRLKFGGLKYVFKTKLKTGKTTKTSLKWFKPIKDKQTKGVIINMTKSKLKAFNKEMLINWKDNA